MYCVFEIKVGSFWKRYHSCNRFAKEKSLTITNIFKNIASNTQVESSATPLLKIDEVEKIQRQRIASFIGHVIQLTYAAMVDKLIQQEKLNHCHGCAIQHPRQNQHSCLMMENDDAWMYYHDEVVEILTWILCWNLPKAYAVLLASS